MIEAQQDAPGGANPNSWSNVINCRMTEDDITLNHPGKSPDAERVGLFFA